MLNIFYEDSEINNVFWKKINKEFFANNCILKPIRRISEIVPLIYGIPDGLENNNLIIELEAGYFDACIDYAVKIKEAAQGRGIKLYISELNSIEEALLSCGYTEVLCRNSFELSEFSRDFGQTAAFLCESRDRDEIKKRLFELGTRLGLCVRAEMSCREISRQIIFAFSEKENVLSEAEFYSEFIDNILQSMEVFGIDRKWLSLEECSEFSGLGIGFDKMRAMASRYKSLDGLVKALAADTELFRFRDGFKMEPEVLRDSLDSYFKGLYRDKISRVLSDDYFDALMNKFRETAVLSFARAYFKSREKILIEYASKIFNQGLAERDVLSVFKEWNTEYVRYILYENAEKEELGG